MDCFKSRQDLIDANMASIHIPLFLDKQFSRPFRGARYVDGSFQSKTSDYTDGSGDAVTLEYAGDELLSSSAGGFVKLVSKEGVWRMMEYGRAYAKKLEGEGHFRRLDLG